VKKFRFLLFDANVIIEISRHGLWDRIVAACDIHLAQTVIDEAQFFEDAEGNRHDINLSAFTESRAINVFSLTPTDISGLRARFSPGYFEKLDPGETESLAYLLRQSDECQICSADKIVFRVLGNLSRAEQGISLEEILQRIGSGRKLQRKFTRQYREEWTKKGFQEKLGGAGMTDGP